MSEEAKTVLVVDDDPDVVEVAKVVLESAGFTVVTADNGTDAIEIARQIRPDLIMLDVMMTIESEGFQTSYQLKSDPATSSIPIVMVSAIGEHMGMDFSPQSDGEYLPVVEFLAKPVAPHDLIACAKRVLGEE